MAGKRRSRGALSLENAPRFDHEKLTYRYAGRDALIA